MFHVLQPEGWVPAKGYANGIEARGRLVFVAGMIGWNAQSQFETDDFVAQCRQAMQNIVATLACAGAGPQHMTRMTWYIKDKKEYLARGRELGKAYQEILGRNYPAMTLIQVVDLLEDRAQVEIEVTAVVNDALPPPSHSNPVIASEARRSLSGERLPRPVGPRNDGVPPSSHSNPVIASEARRSLSGERLPRPVGPRNDGVPPPSHSNPVIASEARRPLSGERLPRPDGPRNDGEGGG